MVQIVLPLYNVNNQFREPHIILPDQRIHRNWLNHVIHEVEPLGVLQTSFS